MAQDAEPFQLVIPVEFLPAEGVRRPQPLDRRAS
jgi:hypothetical protein